LERRYREEIQGLHYDIEREFSEGFVVLSRHYGLLLDAHRLEHNKVFSWDVGCDAKSVMRAEKIRSLTVDKIGGVLERGENPLAAIYYISSTKMVDMGNLVQMPSLRHIFGS